MGWEGVSGLHSKGERFYSLVRKNEYQITALDKTNDRYRIKYESKREKWVPMNELYAIYPELYRLGTLPRNYLRNPENSIRIIGRGKWHAPGASMYAILPVLDKSI